MRPRIIFMDLEGTLLRRAAHLDNQKVAPSAWTLVAEALGPEALEAEEATKDKWLRGEYASYIEWMVESVQVYKRYGLTRQVFEMTTRSVEMAPGVSQALERFRSWGSRTAIISGGFKALADKVQISQKIDHAFSACELFFDETGHLAHYNLLPTDYEGKTDFMRLLMREYRCEPGNCVFVGDGDNDVPLAKQTGVSIAFNAQNYLKAISTYAVQQPAGDEDFFEVARVIDSHR